MWLDIGVGSRFLIRVRDRKCSDGGLRAFMVRNQLRKCFDAPLE